MKMAGKTGDGRYQKRKISAKQKLWILLILTLLLLLAAIFAESICPYDPNMQNYDMALKPPDAAHPFGTDRYGRDMLSRVIIGARTSIFSALLLVLIIAVIGTTVGVLCGYAGGAVDMVLMRVSDVCLAFPGLVFALAIAAVLNGGVGNANPRAGSDQLAQICAPGKKSDACGKKGGIYFGGPARRGLSVSDHCASYSAQYPGTDSRDSDARCRDNDDGDGSALLSRAGSQPPDRRMGQHDERGKKYVSDLSLGCADAGIGIFVTVVLFNLLGDAVRDCMDPATREERGIL